ncbi:MAG: tetratricopeptide repeat protein [Acidobacteria bacterium]|nr:tetratricopeptide repeat protein [Acidobacteriota bacterium]
MALTLAVVVFGIYSRSLGFQFILDDHRFTSDPRIQDGGHIWDYFSNYVWAQFAGGPPSFYRPVFLLWVRMNFMLAALSSWGWHFLSIAKHVVAAALVGMLGWRLLADWKAAFAAAILFALHPAQTESVSWVTVPDPLMTAALLGALLLYFRSLSPAIPARPERKARKKSATRISENPLLWRMAAAGMYFAALLTKETAIIFPAVIFALAVFREPARPSNQTNKRGGADFGARLAQGVGHIMPFVCATALYLLLRFHALGGKLGSPTQHLPWRTVVLSWPAILWFYVKAMLWPVRSYSFADPTVLATFSVRGVLFPLLAFAGFAAVVLTASFWAWGKARPESGADRREAVRDALITGTLLLFLPLILTLNLNSLNPGDFLHGRYTYLPLAGLVLLIAAWWCRFEEIRAIWPAAAGVLAITFAVLTIFQERQWKDDATVFSTAHQLAPHNAPVARNLADTSVERALALQGEGRCDEAIPMFNRVIGDYPDNWFALAGLSVCYVKLNDFPKAEESLRRAAEISRNPRVIQQWQELRAQMGLSNSATTD